MSFLMKICDKIHQKPWVLAPTQSNTVGAIAPTVPTQKRTLLFQGAPPLTRLDHVHAVYSCVGDSRQKNAKNACHPRAPMAFIFAARWFY